MWGSKSTSRNAEVVGSVGMPTLYGRLSARLAALSATSRAAARGTHHVRCILLALARGRPVSARLVKICTDARVDLQKKGAFTVLNGHRLCDARVSAYRIAAHRLKPASDPNSSLSFLAHPVGFRCSLECHLEYNRPVLSLYSASGNHRLIPDNETCFFTHYWPVELRHV
jgi:hypothetical protein